MKRPKLPEGKITKRRITADKKQRCGRKIKYDDPTLADQAARILSMKEGLHCSAYECPYCGCMHIGHTPFELIPKDMWIDRGSNGSSR